MPTNYKRDLESRIWSIWENSAPIAASVRAGNRQKYGTEAGWLKSVMQAMQAADYPRIALQVSRFTHSAFQETPSFAMEEISYLDSGGGWIVNRTCSFTATITGAAQKVNDFDDLVENLQSALLATGPKLGLAYVLSWGPLIEEVTPIDQSVDRNTYRPIAKLTWPVTLQFQGTALVNP